MMIIPATSALWRCAGSARSLGAWQVRQLYPTRRVADSEAKARLAGRAVDHAAGSKGGMRWLRSAP